MTSTATAPATSTPSELLYPDLDHELDTTRRMLERVPDGRADWRPHAKSTTLGALATHLSELPRFAVIMLGSDELDWAKQPFTQSPPGATADMVATFDDLAAQMRAAVAAADWAALDRNWKLRAGDQIFVDGRKQVLLRTLCINHIAHHRAQLGVYLRMLDVPIPGTYGPSADEG